MSLTDFRTVKQHFLKQDKNIYDVLYTLDINEWLVPRERKDHFYNLSHEIIYQQLAGKAAKAIFTRFSDLVAGEITPEKILEYEDQELRQAGLSWAKARYIKDLASKVISRELILDDIDNLDDERVIESLTRVKGIGRWTAEMFLFFTLHRENIFSYGDLGLKNGFAKLYRIQDPNKDDIDKVIDSWSPYKSYGSIALWHYLDSNK